MTSPARIPASEPAPATESEPVAAPRDARAALPDQAPLLDQLERLPLPGAIVPVRVQGVRALRALAAARASRGLLVLALPARARGANRRVGLLAGLVQRQSSGAGASLAVVEVLCRVELVRRGQRHGTPIAQLAPARESGRPRASAWAQARNLASALRETSARGEAPQAQRPGRVRRPTSKSRAGRGGTSAAGRAIDALARELLADQDCTPIALELELSRRVERLNELLTAALVCVRARPRPRLRALRGATARTSEARHEPSSAPALEALAGRIALTNLPHAARAHALRALEQLRGMQADSSEAARTRAWIEWMLELPWRARTVDPQGRASFERVARELDASHTGLTEVKQRITELLAVRELSGRSRGGALCLLGPPGVGKSSMALAVARALGRSFTQISVAGLGSAHALAGRARGRDGAQPGLILEGLRRAGALNPVFLIEDIDQLEHVRGGESAGAAAMLAEVLDGERNASVLDQHLGVPMDLSRCLFLATANDVKGIPDCLQERLELVEFPSYTDSEKLAIAQRHLLPRVRERAGLAPAQLRISAHALRALVRHHTEEAGVRQMGRLLDSLARKAALAVVRGERGLRVHERDLARLLGAGNADERLHLVRPAIGIANALAWTSVGGSLLPVEAIAMPGAGRTILTGSVGDVLRESVQAAISLVRSSFGRLGLEADALDRLDLHLHFPSGSTPKDGPSAGIAIATALVSLLTRTPVRHNVAMTGELSLHGDVLPVGGLRDKLLAAARAGCTGVIAPARNADELRQLPSEVRSALDIRLVQRVEDVFEIALARSGMPRARGSLALRAAQSARSREPVRKRAGAAKEPQRKRARAAREPQRKRARSAQEQQPKGARGTRDPRARDL